MPSPTGVRVGVRASVHAGVGGAEAGHQRRVALLAQLVVLDL